MEHDMKLNKLGGIDNLSVKDLKKAKDVDLITLPKDVKGTNCGNCKWIKSVSKNIGYCKNEKVTQYVNGNMCCVLWTHHGEHRAFADRLDKYI